MKTIVLAVGLGMVLAGYGAGDVPQASVEEIGRAIVVDGSRIELDAAVRFVAMEASEAYAGWIADFAVTFDRKIAEGGVALYGAEDGWAAFPAMEYDGTVYLLKAMGLGGLVDYAALLEMKEFSCGVKLQENSLNGTQVDIELRLTDPSDSGNFVTISRYSRKLMVAKTANWFDARIADYSSWPMDGQRARGGAWRAEESLEDAAELRMDGVLSVDADALDFVARRPKTLGSSAERISSTSDIAFGINEPDELPDVDPTWKGGLVRVKEAEGEAYYGLAKEGAANAWKRLAGPVPTDGTVRFTMTLRCNNGLPVVSYMINGEACTLDGERLIPLILSGPVSGVSLGGAGTLTSLAADAESGTVLSIR